MDLEARAIQLGEEERLLQDQVTTLEMEEQQLRDEVAALDAEIDLMEEG